MRGVWIGVVLLLACASAPQPPAPGTAQAFGDLRLVPREGVTPGHAGGGSYGDRRMRDVEFVDYSRPGFAVVYVEEAEPPAGRVDLVVRASRLGTRLEPALAAVGAAGRVAVSNETEVAHVLSYPAAGAVQKLQPGERVEFSLPEPGEQGLFLLDVPDSGATLFAAPGAFSVVSAVGHYELRGLAPGRRALHVWHPRFPPAVTEVDLPADTSVQVDLEIGVGRDGGGAHAH